MATTRAAGMGCAVKAFGAWVLFVASGTILALAAGYLAAGISLRRAEEAWARRVEPMESFIASYPAEPDSPAARALDEMVRPLGIQLVARPGDDLQERPHDELLKELGSFISDRERGGTDRLESLPPEFRAFLAREGRLLASVETQILEGGPLRLKQQVTKGVAAPMPRLLAHRQIHTLLLARAWEATPRGRRREAERALEASWVLSRSLSDRPALISRLIFVAVSSMQHGLLRAGRVPPEPWLPRMQERDFADGIRASLQLEAWSWTRYGTGLWGVLDIDYMERGETPPPSAAGDIGRFLTAPYMRLSFAGLSSNLLRASEELHAQTRCDFDVEQYAEDFEASYPRWNVLARIASPALIRAWTSLRHADLDRELTEQVLAARERRRISRSWPTGPVPSSVCEGVSWVRERQADDSLLVRPSAPPFPTEEDQRDWSFRLRP